jgi:hypothetical protein
MNVLNASFPPSCIVSSLPIAEEAEADLHLLELVLVPFVHGN